MSSSGRVSQADDAPENPPPPRLDALTVTVITKNAAPTIERCLRSVAFAGRVVVVDCGSTDDTVALAQRLGAEVHLTPDWPGFGAQKNRALDHAATPWVLSLDADEWCPEPLAAEIARVVAAGTASADGYAIARRNRYRGRHIRGLNWWPDRNVRLFRRERGRFCDREVFEYVEVAGRVAQLPRRAAIEHEPLRDLGQWVMRNVEYARARARDRARAGKRVALPKLLLDAPWRFARDYLLRGGFRYGVPGLLIAATNAYQTFVRNALGWLAAHERSPATPAVAAPALAEPGASDGSSPPRPYTVLFACVHNAGRSQLAAALFNARVDPVRARAISAGTEPAACVHPEVIRALAAWGIDIATATPQMLTPALAREADRLVTMGCGEQCPAVPGLPREDWPLADPKGERLAVVESIRDEIAGRVRKLVAEHDLTPAAPRHGAPSRAAPPPATKID